MSTDRKNYKVLIVDDDPAFHQEMRYAFRRNYDIEGAIGVEQMYQKLDDITPIDLILLDLVLDDSTKEKIGLDLIPILQEKVRGIPIIIVTNDKTVDTVVQAMRLGAKSFLPKDNFDYDAWDKLFLDIIEGSQLKRDNKVLKQQLEAIEAEYIYRNPPDFPLLGNSPQMEHIRRTLKTVANEPDLTVLITGETGVGKSIAARFLHYNSIDRRDKPFEEILISNIPESLLESTLFGARKGTFTGATENIKGRLHMADNGIVFLDEIGDLNLDNQLKLLQFLQTKKIRPVGSEKDIKLDVQIVAATNKNLREEVNKGHFREDLYQRLKVFPIEIPPLRERREDIIPLLVHFMELDRVGELDDKLTPRAKKILTEECNWVGNIRELENSVKFMRVQARVRGLDLINVECLPPEVRGNTEHKARQSNHVEQPHISTANNPNSVAHLSVDEQNTWITLSAIEKALREKTG
jgi:DNA-binding NtrC family response regulator